MDRRRKVEVVIVGEGTAKIEETGALERRTVIPRFSGVLEGEDTGSAWSCCWQIF